MTKAPPERGFSLKRHAKPERAAFLDMQVVALSAGGDGGSGVLEQSKDLFGMPPSGLTIRCDCTPSSGAREISTTILGAIRLDGPSATREVIEVREALEETKAHGIRFKSAKPKGRPAQDHPAEYC